MSVMHGNDNQSLGLNVAENASDVDTPSSGRTTLFPKSGGWYIIDDAGLVTKVAEEATAPTFSDLTISDASTPTITLSDTTTPVTATLSAGDSVATLQTTTAHSLVLGTNSTAAITIDSSQAVTITGQVAQSYTIVATSGVVNNTRFVSTTTPSGASTAITQGIEVVNGSTGSADMSGAVISGASFLARHANTTAMGSLYGFSSTARQTSTGGGITNVFGTNFIVQNQSATAGISTARAVYIGSATDSGGGIGTNIGLQIEDQTVGTTNYAILTGAGQVQFGDDVHIDSILTMLADQTSDTAPTADTSRKKLTVQYLASPPSNAAYWAATNSPGGSVFYLVLEEG